MDFKLAGNDNFQLNPKPTQFEPLQRAASETGGGANNVGNYGGQSVGALDRQAVSYGATSSANADNAGSASANGQDDPIKQLLMMLVLELVQKLLGNGAKAGDQNADDSSVSGPQPKNQFAQKAAEPTQAQAPDNATPTTTTPAVQGDSTSAVAPAQKSVASPAAAEQSNPTAAPAPITASAPVDQPSKTQPANSINVKDAQFGVKGDGSADDQVGLQKALQAAKDQNKSLYIPEGTYNHSGVLEADGVKIEGAGAGTELHATTAAAAAIKLTGDNPSISGVKTTVSASDRSSQPDAAAILVQNANNAKVTNCDTVGAGSNGIRLDGATNSDISHNLVSGSNADGIAMMNGSTGNHVHDNVVDQAGDDCISSNSYKGDAVQTGHNEVNNNLMQNSRFGRAGISMGGIEDDFHDNYVKNAPEHAVFAAGTDANSDTMQGSGTVMRNNKVNTDDIPSVAEILGRDPGVLAAVSTYSNNVAGTGAGSNNTPGQRS